MYGNRRAYLLIKGIDYLPVHSSYLVSYVSVERLLFLDEKIRYTAFPSGGRVDYSPEVVNNLIAD